MPRLLIVHHTPSPAMQELLEAALEGAGNDELVDLDVVTRPALTASPIDVFGADGIVLGTPANIGYMSGALKHFFDTVYYPCLQETRALPFGMYVHGNSDTSGAVRAILAITKGLRWQQVGEPVAATGETTKRELAAVQNLAATVAAHALSLID